MTARVTGTGSRKERRMTDRVHSLTITLEKDIREIDVEGLITAIRQLRGVLDVSGHVADVNTHMAYTRARAEILNKLFDTFEM